MHKTGCGFLHPVFFTSGSFMEIFEFDAVLKAGIRGGVYVDFPYSVFENFGTRGQIRVYGTIEGQPFRLALAPMGNEFHALGIRKEITETIRKKVGDLVHVVLMEDKEPRIVEIPQDVKEAFDLNPGTEDLFRRYSFTHQKEYISTIIEAKKKETREKRIAQMISDFLIKI